MFQVDELQFGRVSWYYEEVAGDSVPADMGRPHFTPMDLGARWIARRDGWESGARIIALGGGDSGIDHHLAAGGVEPISMASADGGYAQGAYLLTGAEQAWKLLHSGALDGLHKLIFPFCKVLLAVQLPFASNRGFKRVCAVAEEEGHWLAMPADVFRAEQQGIPCELALESPAVLARMVCCRLVAGSELALAPWSVDRFVFDPDVMTTAVGGAVDSHAAAVRLAVSGAERADRHGILLMGLARTARI